MLWEVDIYPADGQPDLWAGTSPPRPPSWGWPAGLSVAAARGYFIQGELDRADGADRRRIAHRPHRRADRRRGGGRRGAVAAAGRRSRRTSYAVGGSAPECACYAGPRLAQARGDGPGRPERDVGDRRFRLLRRGRPDAEEILDRRAGGRPPRPAGLEAPGQRRHRAGGRRTADLSPAGGRRALRVPPGDRSDPARWTTRTCGD